MAKISTGGAVTKELFDFAYNYKLRNLEKGLQQDKSAPILDKLVFDKVKQGFGRRVRLMLSGVAPLPKHVEEFVLYSHKDLTSSSTSNWFTPTKSAKKVSLTVTSIIDRLKKLYIQNLKPFGLMILFHLYWSLGHWYPKGLDLLLMEALQSCSCWSMLVLLSKCLGIFFPSVILDTIKRIRQVDLQFFAKPLVSAPAKDLITQVSFYFL